MSETELVYVIVAGVALLLIRTLLRNARGGRPSCGCAGGSAGCGQAKLCQIAGVKSADAHGRSKAH